jgi:Immunoglobulin I-set domain
MNSILTRALALGALLLLAACGGGGGSAAGGGGGGTPAPIISTQPASVTVADGAAASFTVTAMSTVTLSYQWQRNGTDISGATAASYGLTAAYPANNGDLYKVKVTNSTGTTTSAAAKLTVTPIAPKITTIQLPAMAPLRNSQRRLLAARRWPISGSPRQPAARYLPTSGAPRAAATSCGCRSSRATTSASSGSS